ncbi:MAG: DUF3299 domain-containing protein [Steroidobacteraceae bacterium]
MKRRGLVLLLAGWMLAADGAPRTLDWVELLPEGARATYDPAPPAPLHDYLTGEASGLAAQQVMDFTVNEALDGAEVKLPGFIVPLELDESGKVTEFFLVPFFGACIHVPPPPPNQLVLVTMKQGLSLDSMYTAYSITGRMSIVRTATSLGTSAYTLAGTAAEEYRF